MKKQVNFNVKTFNKSQYTNIINTEFTEFNQRDIVQEEEQTPNISDFFNMYSTLFYDIPQRGFNSHESLIVRSSEYIDYVFENDTIESLQREITELRQQLLDEQRKTAIELQAVASSSLNKTI